MSAAPRMTAPSRRTLLLAAGLAIVAALAALLLGARIEPVVNDLMLTRFHLGAPPRQPIVIIAIDEDTLATLTYRSPVDRGFLAALITRIDAGSPRAIGLDLLLDQPSEPQKDREFIEAVEKARAPVILGLADRRDGLTARQERFLRQFVGTRRAGLVALRSDELDGIVRRFSTGRVIDGRWRPPLARAMLGAADSPAGDARTSRQRIVYRGDGAGGPYAFPLYPAHAVRFLPPAWFTGKFVLIGANLPATDLHGTPFVAALGTRAGTLPGVVIHAHMLAQLLAGDRLEMAAPGLRLALVLLSAAVSVAVFLAPVPLALRIAGLGLVIAAIFLSAYLLILRADLQIPVLTPSLAAILAAAFISFLHWYRDRRERAFIQNAFSRYVSPALVERIASHEYRLELGGEKRVVTCLFTDLAGFTAFSERLPPGEVAAILNDYLDHVCALFTAAEATIDKIIGDAVVGFFGAPVRQQDQAVRAVELALRIDAFSEEFRRKLEHRGTTLGATRIGIHKGEAIVGNFGGSRFFDYTAIGDTVNTAARLEGANRYLGTRILASAAVRNDDPVHDFRPAARLVLKGRTGGIDCFEPLRPDRALSRAMAAYRRGFALMSTGAAGAGAALEQALAMDPADSLARLHLERLQRGEKGATLVLSEK